MMKYLGEQNIVGLETSRIYKQFLCTLSSYIIIIKSEGFRFKSFLFVAAAVFWCSLRDQARRVPGAKGLDMILEVCAMKLFLVWGWLHVCLIIFEVVMTDGAVFALATWFGHKLS